MILSKADLRTQMRIRRKYLSVAEERFAALELLTNIKPLLAGVNSLAIYFAAYHELDLTAVIDYSLAHGKKIYRPIAYRSTKFLQFEPIRLDCNRDIFVEDDYLPIAPRALEQIDLVLIPLLACDYQGNRLGQGGGYYDASLQNLARRPQLCGIGYDWQLVPQLISDEWDVKLDYFASDKRLLNFEI